MLIKSSTIKSTTLKTFTTNQDITTTQTTPRTIETDPLIDIEIDICISITTSEKDNSQIIDFFSFKTKVILLHERWLDTDNY